ncbi:MAG TPA: DUF1461 domain-containing protein [Anaerolineae bacterium]|nr:DUF1461 domain-containing protein [Anaerolineae bacterium]HOR00008.1 DUF1461 domain-containing protein [Anaerolineae bacterium]HPL27197.1 DUF1461 domain-containing protein [Anaerolineae bacterium]
MRVAAPIGRTFLALSVFLAVPAAIVLLGFHALGPWFVAQQYAQPGFPPAERYQPAERLALAQETVRLLTSPNGEEGLRALRRGSELVYNDREVGHLVDVMKVLGAMRWLLAVTGAIWLGSLGVALARPAWRRSLARSTFWGSVALLAVLAGLLIAALLAFDTFFIRFHEVLFAADTWTFDYADSLIQFYPVQFWMSFFYTLGAAIVVGDLAVAVAAFAWLRRTPAAARP